MRTKATFSILPLFVLLWFASCSKDEQLPIVKHLKGQCLIASDTTDYIGNNGFSSYEFEPNTNRLKIAKHVGNGVLLEYRQVYYQQNDVPEKSITYVNANEFYETRFYYANGSAMPYKCELFFTSKLNNIYSRNLWGFGFSYDKKDRLVRVAFTSPITGDHEYALNIIYTGNDNVTSLEYESTSGPSLPKSIITVHAYDNQPNPYSTIPYWKFLMINANWDSYDPEPIITALSRNNPLSYSIGNFKREMTYTYNQNGLPVSRLNINKAQGGHYTFQEKFHYGCQ